ncbi:hypothetical protein ACNJYD_08960 [Bradyrhizobium sp. DASA03005]|uniref:hypothetical protein n=1 Tax=Bradyrhizobium sp. SPXBL-02 TaxID=3395912 RepID=UPI003F6FDF8C
MRVTIIPLENRIIVEGFSEAVDCSSLDPAIHVVHWYGEHGEIEFVNTAGTVKANETITDFAAYQHLVDAWELEAQKNVA